MLGDQPNWTINKIESRDVIFLEGKFSRKEDINDIDRFVFLKWTSHMKALLILVRKMRVTYCLVGVYIQVSVLLGIDFEATFLRRSQRGNIHRRRFEIEGEAFTCALQEADEPKNYQEAMQSPTSEE